MRGIEKTARRFFTFIFQHFRTLHTSPHVRYPRFLLKLPLLLFLSLFSRFYGRIPVAGRSNVKGVGEIECNCGNTGCQLDRRKCTGNSGWHKS